MPLQRDGEHHAEAGQPDEGRIKMAPGTRNVVVVRLSGFNFCPETVRTAFALA